MTANNLDKTGLMLSITRLKRSNCSQPKVREKTTKLIHWTTTISIAAFFLLHSLVIEKKDVEDQAAQGVGHCLVEVFLASLHFRKKNKIC